MSFRIDRTPENQNLVPSQESEQVQKQNPADSLTLANSISGNKDESNIEQQIDFEKFFNDSKKKFKDFQNNAQNEFNDFSKPSMGLKAKTQKNTQEVGHTVPIRFPDNTSIVVNFKNGTITKYTSEGKNDGQRNFTADEKNMPSDELIKKLSQEYRNSLKTEEVTEPNKNNVNKSINETSQKQNGFSDNARIIKNNSGIIKYEFIETEDGVQLLKNGSIIPFKNKDVRAFQETFDNNIPSDYATKNDSKGYYYRGLFARTHGALGSIVRAKAKTIALDAAIYRDLQAKQAEGEVLKDYEKSFMQDFLDSLPNYGLQLNEDNELEDLPIKKGRKK